MIETVLQITILVIIGAVAWVYREPIIHVAKVLLARDKKDGDVKDVRDER